MATSESPTELVTLRDVIHCGMRLGIGQTRTLDIAREFGFEIRDMDFAQQWRDEVEAFRQWRRQS